MVVSALGLVVLDMTATTFIWGVLGYQQFDQNLNAFFENQFSQFTFTSSLADVICVSVARMVLLSLFYWRIRTSFSGLVKSAVVLIPLACILFLAVKSVMVGMYMRGAGPLEIASMAVILSISSIFCFLELLYARATMKKEGEEVGFYYQKLEGQEEEEEAFGIEEEKENESKNKDKKKKKPSHANFKRVASLAIPEIPILLLATVALLLSSAATLAMPAYFGMIIGAVATSKNYGELVDAILGLIVISLSGSVFTFFRAWLFTLAGERLVARLRNTLFAVMTFQDISFFDKNRTGELTNRLASDTQVIQNAATVNVSMFLRYVVQALGAFVILFLVSWKLTLVMLSVGEFPRLDFLI